MRHIMLTAVLITAAVIAGNAAGMEPAADERVIGLTMGGTHRAYPITLFDEAAVVNDDMGHLAVLVFYNKDTGYASAFFRLVGGEPLLFSGNAAGMIADDLTTATRWDMATGDAVSGNLVGMKLIPIPAAKDHFGEWLKKHPGGTVFQQ